MELWFGSSVYPVDAFDLVLYWSQSHTNDDVFQWSQLSSSSNVYLRGPNWLICFLSM